MIWCAEYVGKEQVMTRFVLIWSMYISSRKYGVNGAELLIGAAGAEPQERIHDIMWE